jgi:hypothetical protein
MQILKDIFRRILCRHKGAVWFQIGGIAWDGETTWECKLCGKRKNIPIG